MPRRGCSHSSFRATCADRGRLAGQRRRARRPAEGRPRRRRWSRSSSDVAHPLPGLTLIRNARVFDSEHATLGEPAGRLRLPRPHQRRAAGRKSPSAGADNVVDAGGRVLLPGLFDMHSHLSRWDGGLHVAAGVTSARDMGNDNASLQQMITEERAGTLLMPRIVPAGFIEGESQYAARGGFVIKDLQSTPRTPSTGMRTTAIRRSRSTTRSRRKSCATPWRTRTAAACASAATCRRSCARRTSSTRATTRSSTSTRCC